MKDKIMFLIIGMLIGAIIVTSGFLIYNKSISNNNLNQAGMMKQEGQMGEPPEKPNRDNGDYLAVICADNDEYFDSEEEDPDAALSDLFSAMRFE